MLYILIVIAIVVAEYKIKKHMEEKVSMEEKKEILGRRIIIRKSHNRGGILNFLENKMELVRTISCVFLGIMLIVFAIILPKKGNRLFKLGLSLALGGAISNVSDRVNRGYVVDYFSFNCKPLKNIVFNLSDIAIFIGSFIIFLSTVFSPKVESPMEEIDR